MLYGALNLSFGGYCLFLLILTQITIASVTIYLHRYQAHRSLELHPIISHFFRFWLWLTTGMVTKEWAAIHRKHHAYCETKDDPHSPQVVGITRVLFRGTELYKAEAKNKDTIERYGYGTPDDWIERNLYSRYSALGVSILLVLDVILLGLPGVTVWTIQMVWIPFFAAGVVNGIGHYWGYRNFECSDQARNILPLGIFIGGEELHNNHHAFGTSAKLSNKWWEFDIGWMYICILRFLGLAKVKRVAPKPFRIAHKNTIDLATLKGIFSNRLEVINSYSQKVILPILHEEKQKANKHMRSSLTKARKWLVRNEKLVSNAARQSLDSIFETSQNLNVVYQYRQKLQGIWDRTAASQRELLDALQDWCKQAESTGIDALQQFAGYLRTYTLRPTHKREN